MLSRSLRATAAAILLAVLFSVPLSYAAVSDLTTALLKGSDAPSIFLTPRHAIYPHFIRSMGIPIGKKGKTQYRTTCTGPDKQLQKGWSEGLIESFDVKDALTHFQELKLCAWRFYGLSGARVTFKAVTAPLRAALKNKRALSIPNSSLGSESFSAVGKPAARGEEIVWRHANATLTLSYVGPGTVSPSQLVRLAKLVNSRLR